MDNRTWWALQFSIAIVSVAFSSAIAIYGFNADPAVAVSGSILGAWIGVGINLAQRLASGSGNE